MKIDRLRRFDETARVMWALFLTLWFAYAFAHTLSGCSESAKRDIRNFFTAFKSCEQRALIGELAAPQAELIKDVNEAIAGNISFDSAEWKTTGKNLGIKFGVDTIKCLASSLWQEIIARKSDVSDMGFKPGMRMAKLKPESEKYLEAVFNSAGK